MRITIEYESSWRNSFLAGSNNEPLPKTGRKFIGSMTSLKKAEHYIEREVSLDTVMGVLNRLIGDQRKLYQSRQQPHYFFRELEPIVNFNDYPSHVSNEVVYIRNITGSTDQNAYTGMIKVSEPIFTSDYSSELWGILALSIDDLCDFIIEETPTQKTLDLDPLTITSAFEEINTLKTLPQEGKVKVAFDILNHHFDKFKGVNNKNEVYPLALYCSGLYLQLERLEKRYDMRSAKTKSGGLSGISNNGFTKKDFMGRYTTGEKKKIWGNPYVRKERLKGLGEVTSVLKKASGKLEIEIPVEREKAKEIKLMIENAGVSSFYLGKKGLAYVSHIRL